MKKVYLQPKIDYTVFAKQGDVVLNSQFIDKNEPQPDGWNKWIIMGGDKS